MKEVDIIRFYGWWELSICSFAFLALMAIWYHLGKKKGDFGQVWLSLAVLCWAISGVFEIIYVERFELNIGGWRSIFSLLNSLFILLSLPWFRHKPRWIAEVLESRYWYLIVGVPFLFCLVPTISGMIKGETAFISELDVYYAILTLVVLGGVLWESFTKRGLLLLAYLSMVFVIITLVSQLYKFTDDSATLLLTAAVFKSILIMIFFALALSWVKDLAEQIVIEPNKLGLELKIEPLGKERKKYIALLSGIGNNDLQSISLTAGNFTLLKKFCLSKIENGDAGWLEIKPKNDARSGKKYDIKDYNEIKRLNHALLDGLYGKQKWSKERHEIPLKHGLWEFAHDASRRIRIRIEASSMKVY
jgi:hypothetical protein